MFEIVAPNSPRDDLQRIVREAAAAAPSFGLRMRIQTSHLKEDGGRTRDRTLDLSRVNHNL